MSKEESWKTTGLQILQMHTEDCGDGSCGCGCGPFVSVRVPEKAEPEECCAPACGPETCG